MILHGLATCGMTIYTHLESNFQLFEVSLKHFLIKNKLFYIFQVLIQEWTS